MTLRALFIVAALIADSVSGGLFDIMGCESSSCHPAPGNLLIGRDSRLSTTSTHADHPIQNIIDEFHAGTRTQSWWQAENGKENVTIQLDLEAKFRFTDLLIKFKTYRPKAMLVERSFDFGKTWHVYRYFAYNCNEAFPGVPVHSPRYLTEVVCESRYSGVAPASEGIVVFHVVPSNLKTADSYSEEVENLQLITNLRVNFTQLHAISEDYFESEVQENCYA
ncbi:hypothetical protein O0L34_g10736 [Tuta absoluta]|nr:hypothetical protein O0L34_g10736 [Tuta absoluta]